MMIVLKTRYHVDLMAGGHVGHFMRCGHFCGAPLPAETECCLCRLGRADADCKVCACGG